MTSTVEYMQRHLAEPLTIPDLAARVQLSPSRFRDLFSEHTGLGPALYLERLRLRRARVLIERTFLSIKEVMAFTGYDDATRFSREFRRHHGISPASLRERGPTASLPRGNDEAAPPRKPARGPRARDPGSGFVYA